MTKKGKNKQKKMLRKSSHERKINAKVIQTEESTKLSNEALSAINGGWKRPSSSDFKDIPHKISQEKN